MRRCEGFTLFELLVALALSTLVALIGAAALSAGLDYYERGLERLREHEALRAAERTLRIEWGARQPRGFLAKPGWLEFDTATQVFSRRVLGAQRVRYRCEADAGGRQMLTHELLGRPPAGSSSAAPVGAPPTSPAVAAHAGEPALAVVQREVLVAGLGRCELAYLSVSPKDPSAREKLRWVTAWDLQAAAPLLLRASLTGRRGESPPIVVVAPK